MKLGKFDIKDAFVLVMILTVGIIVAGCNNVDNNAEVPKGDNGNSLNVPYGTCTPELIGKPCTKEYMPVCGNNGVTYGNKCTACSSGESQSYVEGPCAIVEKKDEKVVCTPEQKSALVCTMEYMPVCGNDGKTYGNKCGACASATVESYVDGECQITENTELNFLLSHNWKLIQINGKEVSGNNPDMMFNSTSKMISGFAGCNRMFGPYEISDDTMSFKMIGMTMMMCQEGMEIESEFTSALSEKSYKWDLADQTLNLYSNEKLVLMFGVMN